MLASYATTDNPDLEFLCSIFGPRAFMIKRKPWHYQNLPCLSTKAEPRTIKIL